MRAALATLLLAGCGIYEGDFVDQYTTNLCEHTLACSDNAELTFDGVLDVEDCFELRLGDVGAWGAGCKFRPGPAEDCLADMATLTCPPAEGTLAERPVSCEGVYVDCSTGAVE